MMKMKITTFDGNETAWEGDENLQGVGAHQFSNSIVNIWLQI